MVEEEPSRLVSVMNEELNSEKASARHRQHRRASWTSPSGEKPVANDPVGAKPSDEPAPNKDISPNSQHHSRRSTGNSPIEVDGCLMDALKKLSDEDDYASLNAYVLDDYISCTARDSLTCASSVITNAISYAESEYTIKMKNRKHRNKYQSQRGTGVGLVIDEAEETIEDVPCRRQPRRSSWHASSLTPTASEEETVLKKIKKKKKKQTSSRMFESRQGQAAEGSGQEDIPTSDAFREWTVALDAAPKTSVRTMKSSKKSLLSEHNMRSTAGVVAVAIDQTNCVFDDDGKVFIVQATADSDDDGENPTEECAGTIPVGNKDDDRRRMMMQHKQMVQNVELKAPSKMMRRSSWSGEGSLVVPSLTLLEVPAPDALAEAEVVCKDDESYNDDKPQFESDFVDFVPPPSFGRFASWHGALHVDHDLVDKIHDLVGGSDCDGDEQLTDDNQGNMSQKQYTSSSLIASGATSNSNSGTLNISGQRSMLALKQVNNDDERHQPRRRQPRRSSWHSSSDPNYLGSDTATITMVMQHKSKSQNSVLQGVNTSFADEAQSPKPIVKNQAGRRNSWASVYEDLSNGLLGEDTNVGSVDDSDDSDEDENENLEDESYGRGGLFGRRRRRASIGDARELLPCKPDEDSGKGLFRSLRRGSIGVDKTITMDEAKEGGKGLFRALRRGSMGSKEKTPGSELNKGQSKSPAPPRLAAAPPSPMKVSRHTMPRIDAEDNEWEDGAGVDCIQLTDLGAVITVTYADATMEL
jgi:hypothetical protein